MLASQHIHIYGYKLIPGFVHVKAKAIAQQCINQIH